MSVILFVSALSVGVSALCSLMEATIYAVPVAYVKNFEQRGSWAGRKLAHYKEKIAKPIAAILILNTVANSGGAAVAGALVIETYGESATASFTALFVLVVLYFSEIIPKQIGVSHAKALAPVLVYPLHFIVVVLSPAILVVNFFSALFEKESNVVSPEEVTSLAQLGGEEGSLDSLEAQVIKNVVGLDSVLVRDILTPRVVVSRVDEEATVASLEETILDWRHSRIPVYNSNDPDHVTSYVLQRDLNRFLLTGDRSKKVGELSRPLLIVPESTTADKVLAQFFTAGEHIAGVVNEHGGFAGIVTMEDVVEEIIGAEIMDEYDKVEDLRKYARTRYLKKNETS